MTFQEFDNFFDSLIDEARKMRDTKGKEYAHGVDRFDNFNRLAASNNLSRLQVANVFMAKHIDSITSYVKEERTFSEETIRGRFIDVIVYAALMAGMAAEQQEKDKQNTEYKYTIAPPPGSIDAAYTICRKCGVTYSYHVTQYPIACTSETGNHDWVVKEKQ